MNIIFFGTNQFAIPSLQKIAENFNVALVVTKPAKPVGRKQELQPSAIEIEAKKLGLSMVSPENLDDKTIEQIKEINPLFYVVADYGKIISKEILNIPKKGAINIHPSELPKYRGASPIQTAILNGDKETAISIMLMDEKMDHGPILAQKMKKILPDDNYLLLYNRLAESASDFLVETIKKYLSGEIKPQPQDDSAATFTKLLKREDGEIDWDKTSGEIEKMIRAYDPWPGTFVEQVPPLSVRGGQEGLVNKSPTSHSKSKRLKILKASLSSQNYPNKQPGQFFKTTNNQLAITCGQNTTLLIHTLQPEGKKPISGKQFIQGYLK